MTSSRGVAAARSGPSGVQALGAALVLPQAGWLAAHAHESPWLELVWAVAAALLGCVFVALLVRAWIVRRRYAATGILSEEDLVLLHQEIVRAERRTVGEIVPVVLERSDPHDEAEWRAALLTALAGCGALAPWLPWQEPLLLVPAQLALGGLGFACARWLPDFKRRFLSESRATAATEEQALAEFLALGLGETRAGTGVLLLVSLLEHRVVVLGGAGIAAVVPEEHWAKVDQSVLEAVRRGSLRIGLAEGIRRTAEVLSERFPWTEGDRNEIPDRIVVRRE